MKREHGSRDEEFPYKTKTEFEDGKFDVPLENGTYIVFDIETTGGNPERNGITEICALKYSHGKVQDTFYTLVNPRIPIPPIVQKMTGITNQTVRNAPLIGDIYPSFLEFIGNDILVSHNTVGDMYFLVHYAMKTCQHKLTNFFLCTHLLSEKTVFDAPNYSLSGLSTFLNLPTGGKSHRAEADAQMTLQLFLEIKKRLRKKEVFIIRDALRFQGHVDTNLRLGLALDEKSFAKAPSTPGVLALYNYKGEMIFAGSTSNIRRELQGLRHQELMQRGFLRLVLQSYHFHSFPTGNLFSAMLKEADFYAKHRFPFHPTRWHGRVLSLLYVLREQDGSLQIGVGPYPYSVLKVLHVFGPVKDLKLTHVALKKLSLLLEGNIEKRVLWIPPEKAHFVSMLFENKIGERLDALRRERFKLANLLSLAKQRKLSAEIEILKELSQLDIIRDFTDVSFVNGVLSLAHDENPGRELYPIVDSHVLKAVVVPSDRSESHRKEVYEKAAQRFHHSEKELHSEADILKTNAMLWMMMVATKKKHFDCQFYPMEPEKKDLKHEK